MATRRKPQELIRVDEREQQRCRGLLGERAANVNGYSLIGYRVGLLLTTAFYIGSPTKRSIINTRTSRFSTSGTLCLLIRQIN